MSEKSIEQLTEELKTKNTWIRQGLQRFFEKWEKIPFEDNIMTLVCQDEIMAYYLSTKVTRDVSISYDSENPLEYSTHSFFYAEESIENVRNYIKNLPDAIHRISERLKKRANFEFPKELEAWLK